MKWFFKKAFFLVAISCAYIAGQAQIRVTLAEKVREGAHYVGMEKCKQCHSEHVETYS